MELVSEVEAGCELGESVLWHPLEQRIWWTDILGCRLYACALNGSELTCWKTPEPLTAFGFTDRAGQLIVSFASGIAYFWPDTGEVQWLARPDIGRAERFNDGRVDPEGRFWAGTMAPGRPGEAALYCYDGELHLALKGLEIANGLCWSPDGRTAYHADSPRRQIREFQVASGRLQRSRRFAHTTDGFPDGACTDAQGNLWSALWGGGKVVCYSSAGKVLGEFSLPVSQPTCVAFGGPEYRHLLVTSAWEHMSPEARAREPRAGNLFIYHQSSPGRPCDLHRVAVERGD